MRKATITKKYLINCLKKYLVEYLYRPITVRDIAKYARTSTQPIYLNFSNMQNYKQAMVDDVFRDIHETKKESEETLDSLYSFWQDYYVFASRNRNLFFALFLNDIGCGPYIKERSFAYFQEAIAESAVFQCAHKSDLRKYHEEALIFFSGLVLLFIREGNTQDNANFLKETQNYWQRILREPVDFYQGDLPKTLLESGLAVSDQ
ncbi:TetR/AcrR family transcriptional regulator [Enterococcus casseliflavus]|uniref:TetR/AcrR family transcriptional regulator n=1 Tax=Enterococcus casseliflavus TaxID=37734 RepID=A0AAW8UP01_ENTCA|nr:TetR/AcrR family transcriptional regulator [Enterococcus casseliflavus]MDB1692846.1 TetR/AcrR family transcriptional regulator [Enterococcus casseliflavus]MDT2963404.1 TetR/AcrR family transcriptional regulator [Enterococcus casseliflavus]